MAAQRLLDRSHGQGAARASKGTPAPTPTRRFRADIQGLRAFAVLVVVAHHLFGWPAGGFVGVDIFFVISGFLITGLLMREWERHGRISFVDFYRRRVKRILPVSVLVLMVTVIGSFIVLGASRAWSVLGDGVWALLFAANWRFASAGTDYFESDGPVSPLQHYWSLAVEEQFYFVWPWVMLGALVLFAGRRRRHPAFPRLVAGGVILVLSAASFLWAMAETTQAPTVAYFSTVSRAWELGIGALLALATPVLLRIPDRSRPALAWTGIGGMLASLLLVTESSGFPAPAALLPVLASGLVIAAGTGGEQRHIQPLTNRVSGYVGDISFSLYLWHMPVVILMGRFMPEPGPAGYLVQIAVMLGLSVASYHLWEDPIRKSPWLTGDPGAWRQFRLPAWYRPVAVATAASLVAAVVVGAAVVSSANDRQRADRAERVEAVQRQLELEDAEQERYAASSRPVEDMAPEELRAALMSGPEASEVRSAVGEALLQTDWGDSRAAVEEETGNTAFISPRFRDCAKAVNDRADCYFGPEDASTQVVLAGDSIGLRWAAALLPLLEDYDWRLNVQGKNGCSFTAVLKAGFASEQQRQDCIDHKAGALDYITTEEPDLVIVSNVADLMDAEGGVETTPERWEQGLQAYVEQFPEDTRAVVVTAPPGNLDIRKCYTPTASVAECTGGPGATWDDTAAASRRAAEATGTAFADVSALFCRVGQCPPVINGVPVRNDRTHITQAYAEYMSPAFGEVLLKALEQRYGPDPLA